MDIHIHPTAGMPGCVCLAVDGTTQTTLDLDDPSHLVDEYTNHIAYLLDSVAPAREPLRVLHLGAGGLALARYVAATRPRSYQQAVEINSEIIDLVRREAPLPKGVKVKIRRGDAREQLSAAPDECYDVIIADLFGGPIVPPHVTTLEFFAEVSRVLRPNGSFAMNVCDGGRLPFARRVAAAVANVFTDAAALLEPGVQRGRRFGNIVLYGSRGMLPVADLSRRAAGANFPSRVLHGRDFERFRGGAQPATDAAALASPMPPTGSLSW